ncbi:MAG: creatininase family protein [Clostridia bacterium]|nr:creatininase family protein [Lachnospiraceae bacterium]NCC02055.1 creatininase family protein [Clostridia bacterium]NCD03920.1 creatininase family protein [Clostridia bacterium]
MLNKMYAMNRESFNELTKKTDLAFLPVSPMEAHGPHLPLSSDVITACQMAEDTARKLQDEGIESLIATPITYCLADVASCFSGTTTIRAETLTAIVEDVCTSLARQGFKKIMLISGHAEGPSIDAIVQGAANVQAKYPDFRFHFSDFFVKGLPLAYHVCRGEHPEWDMHAGEIETSQIMYVHPEWVDMDALKDLPPNHAGEHFFEKWDQGCDNFIDLGAPNTYFGDPAISTAETGRKIFDIVADFIVKEAKDNLL